MGPKGRVAFGTGVWVGPMVIPTIGIGLGAGPEGQRVVLPSFSLFSWVSLSMASRAQMLFLGWAKNRLKKRQGEVRKRGEGWD